MIVAAFQWLKESTLGIFMAENEFAFPWIECIHVIALCITVGSILLLDFRLLGLAYKHWSLKDMSQSLLPVTWWAYAVALVTGICLLSSNALAYLANPAFLLKMTFMAIAGINMLLFHFVTNKNISDIDHITDLSLSARIAGGVSFCCWITVVGAGRWIGFISPW